MLRCCIRRLSVGVDPGDAVAVDVEDAGDGFEGADGSALVASKKEVSGNSISTNVLFENCRI